MSPEQRDCNIMCDGTNCAVADNIEKQFPDKFCTQKTLIELVEASVEIAEDSAENPDSAPKYCASPQSILAALRGVDYPPEYADLKDAIDKAVTKLEELLPPQEEPETTEPQAA